ncbi:MAG: hypothetical protein R3D33_02965 [Hyphomicrobiaceae bacterium]
MSAAQRFKPIGGVPASDADLEAFAVRRGIPSLKAPESILAPPEAPQRANPSTPLGRLTLELPVYLCTEIRMRAASETCSARYLVMKALKEAGFRIDEADLITDARRTAA